MEFKGTKGKWAFCYQPVASNGFYIQTEDKNHSNTFIGEVGGGLQDSIEILANAQLISKAPEMLEMLQKISSELEHLWVNDDSNEIFDVIDAEELDNLIKQATEL
ncbi:hypothetical protein J2X97_000377 [Epilithonimonas hungarica]|uniref:hypothetical protein n=1 Tax=Epilithonimonas hungarica TaxID=454006 RepID=UPI0027885801|nr:hypothetical protein [Epilithonimonas hungarica]MDP9954740.1 hypothetical protein [Epilithonimonas hungarica]